jgi:hypothetical protein
MQQPSQTDVPKELVKDVDSTEAGELASRILDMQMAWTVAHSREDRRFGRWQDFHLQGEVLATRQNHLCSAAQTLFATIGSLFRA